MRHKILTLTGPALITLIAFSLPVAALRSVTGDSSDGQTLSAAQQTALNHLQTRGDAEINRRLATLNKLDAVVNGTQKLSSTDRSNLINQVNASIAGLTALKSKLDAETRLDGARGDAQSIIKDYRVYALVTPKVYLLKAADTELVNNAKLKTLAGKLQTRVNQAREAGNDVTDLQSSLDDMNAQLSTAAGLAQAVNAKVAPLQPTDFNSDHKLLIGQRDQLRAAHADDLVAYNDAKTIVARLE